MLGVLQVSLMECGPSLDLTVRRQQQAAPDLMKHAMTKPKAIASVPKKVKNVERSKLLGKQGRLHMPKQDLGGMATARFKSKRKGMADPEAVGEDRAVGGGSAERRAGAESGAAGGKRRAESGGGPKKKARA